MINATKVDRDIDEDYEDEFIEGLDEELKDMIGTSKGGWLISCNERLWPDIDKDGFIRFKYCWFISTGISANKPPDVSM